MWEWGGGKTGVPGDPPDSEWGAGEAAPEGTYGSGLN